MSGSGGVRSLVRRPASLPPNASRGTSSRELGESEVSSLLMMCGYFVAVVQRAQVRDQLASKGR